MELIEGLEGLKRAFKEKHKSSPPLAGGRRGLDWKDVPLQKVEVPLDEFND
ncbi:hypothetical protein QA635_33025 [Bradyrhizobium brasilense]|uniref:hypothetical protein n=1 Tax=Bradyrhizobium brasilense TaxID=1419277 RepID=UPI0024B147BD|nr:hypothetical protein [Bradyrhizobium australafricanum]WFU31344.1 hypothetical protein QA635_33025 [Bradyrhizobium australafricanum]